jgi:hypothetical protein
MSASRPQPDAAFWADLARSRWRRVRWRKGLGPPGDARCAAFDLPLHRAGTYYRRPVYTDGTRWLSQQAYDEMVRRTAGHRASRTARPPDSARGGASE